MFHLDLIGLSGNEVSESVYKFQKLKKLQNCASYMIYKFFNFLKISQI